MSLSPFYHDTFFHDFNRFFNEAFDARTGINVASNHSQIQLRPRMDIHESKERNEVTATFELPGMKKEDISIDVNANRLTVSGRSSLSDNLEKNGYTIRERQYGSFSRTIPLPPGVKDADVKAAMENGVLTIKFPRSTPEQAPSKININ